MAVVVEEHKVRDGAIHTCKELEGHEPSSPIEARQVYNPSSPVREVLSKKLDNCARSLRLR